jgi:hypothetical protein
MLTVVRSSDERFCRPGSTICRRTKGEMERRPRAFYRRSRGEETAGELKELKRGVTARSGLVTGGISVRRKKKVSVLTRGPHQSVRGREKEWYRFGFFPGPRARFCTGPNRCPLALFLISIFFLLFFFCFSYFFQNFCKDTSIQIKLLPEIFKRKAQYSKSVIKQVFK